LITDLIFGVLCKVAGWVLSILPTWTIPSWVGSATSTISGWMSNVGAVGYFIPLGVITTCFALVLAAGAAALTIRFIRIGASFMTGGGGGAA
jgi:hypothetical protein